VSTTSPEQGVSTVTDLSDFDRLRETVQHLMDSGWHLYTCPRTRAAMRLCTCGWDDAKRHAETVLKATLDGPSDASNGAPT